MHSVPCRYSTKAETVGPALRLLEEAAGYKVALDRRPPARAKQLVPFRTVESGPCNQVVAVTNPHFKTQSGATQHYSASVVCISLQIVKSQSHQYLEHLFLLAAPPRCGNEWKSAR